MLQVSAKGGCMLRWGGGGQGVGMLTGCLRFCPLSHPSPGGVRGPNVLFVFAEEFT